MKRKSVIAILLAATLACQGPVLAFAETIEMTAEELVALGRNSGTEEDPNYEVTISDGNIYVVTGDVVGRVDAINDTDLQVDGDVKYICATGGSNAEISGDVVTVLNCDSSSVSIGGDCSYIAPEAKNTTVFVSGNIGGMIKCTECNITVNGSASDALNSCKDSTISLGGGVKNIVYNSGCDITVGGNVSESINNNTDSTIYVKGNVGNLTVNNNTTVTVEGNVGSALGSNSKCKYIIKGNVCGGGNANANADGIGGALDAEFEIGGDVIGNIGGVSNCKLNIMGNTHDVTVGSSKTNIGGNVLGTLVATSSTDEVTVGGDVYGYVTNYGNIAIQGDVLLLPNYTQYTGYAMSIHGDETGSTFVGGSVYGDIVMSSGYTGKFAVLGDIFSSRPFLSSNSSYDEKPKGEYLVGSLKSADGGAVSANMTEENYAAIKYYVKVDGNSANSVSVTKATGEALSKFEICGQTYDCANENEILIITPVVGEGYYVESVSGGAASVVKNSDGTWTLTVPRNGGINISAVIKAIQKVEEESGNAEPIEVNVNEEPETVSSNNDSNYSTYVIRVTDSGIKLKNWNDVENYIATLTKEEAGEQGILSLKLGMKNAVIPQGVLDALEGNKDITGAVVTLSKTFSIPLMASTDLSAYKNVDFSCGAGSYYYGDVIYFNNRTKLEKPIMLSAKMKYDAMSDDEEYIKQRVHVYRVDSGVRTEIENVTFVGNQVLFEVDELADYLITQ